VNLWESDLALFEVFPEEEAQAADDLGGDLKQSLLKIHSPKRIAKTLGFQ
jgi:hypothetical protein